jgi:hypothetical protein
MWTARLIVVFAFWQAVSAVAQTPSSSLLVLNRGANEMAIVDPVAMKVVGRIPVGDGPHEVPMADWHSSLITVHVRRAIPFR